MRKMIKGFTLVELIAVIVILSIILLISVPSLIGNINNKKQVASNQVYALIKSAAKNYEIDYDVKTEQLLAIEELCERYISCPIIDPYTNEEITGYITIGTDEYRFLNPVKLDVVLGEDATTTQVLDDYYIPYTTINMIEPTRPGYTFERWSVSSDTSVLSGNTLTIGSEDVTLTALWSINTYTITYNLVGGTKGSNAPESGTYGSTVTVSDPTRTNWSFIEWVVSGTGASMNGTSLTIGTGNVTLTARYKTNFRDEITRLYDNTSTRSSNSLDASDPDSNIRYTGTSPKNYVTFNGETWRIVGVFTISGQKRVKIIRNDYIGSRSWDTTASNVNCGNGHNDWSSSDIASYLNNSYLTNNLNSTAQNMTSDGLWNTGAINAVTCGQCTYFLDLSAADFYNQERSNQIGRYDGSNRTCYDSGCCNGRDLPRYTTWTGTIGLPYPSDYIYASTDSTCRNNATNSKRCNIDNWMDKGVRFWTMTPGTFWNWDYGVVSITADSMNVGGWPSSSHQIRPTLYLNESVLVTSDGDGTSTNPYILSVN